MVFSEDDKKFVKSQLTGQVLINVSNGNKNKIKSILFEGDKTVLVFGRVSSDSLDNMAAMILAENGKLQDIDFEGEISNLSIEGFEKEQIEDSILDNIEEDQIVKIESERKDDEQEYYLSLRSELQSLLEEEGIHGYTDRIHNIMIGEDEQFTPDQIEEFLSDPDGSGFGIFGYTNKIKAIYEEHNFNPIDDESAVDIARKHFEVLNDDDLRAAYKKAKEDWNGEENIAGMEITVMEELMDERGIAFTKQEDVSVDESFKESIILALHHNQDKNGSDVEVLMLLRGFKDFGISLDDWYDIKTKNYSFLSKYSDDKKSRMTKALDDYVKGVEEAIEGEELNDTEKDFLYVALTERMVDGKDKRTLENILKKIGRHGI